MKKILIADDHPILRAGTRQVIQDAITDVNVTEVDTFRKALSIAETTTFDLIILDIGIPGGNSVNMVTTFKSRWPAVKILMFSSYDENMYALPFIKAGADGYLSKDASEQALRTALNTILFQNKRYMSEALREESLRLFLQSDKKTEVTRVELSIREREILQLILDGKGVTEIAAMLHLHVSTVSTHRARIFSKMGVDNAMDLARKYEILNLNAKGKDVPSSL